ERVMHKSNFRKHREYFTENSLKDLNERVTIDKKYTFGLKNSLCNSFENDLAIYENDINICNQGTGKQVFIKTDFALEKAGSNIDVILIEEPETHLSHVNLRKLIQRITDTQSGQIFVTTHNSLISTRLELNNLFILSESTNNTPVSLKNLNLDTAKYFLKAPVANIIEFTLSKKAILVEGPSEYMLLEKFYNSLSSTKPEEDNVQIIDIRGLSFKRYLDVAKLLNIKVAVITDNDSDYTKNCIDKYSSHSSELIKIFYEMNNKLSTFEIVLQNDNMELCNKLFKPDPISYMLNNKTESAYKLLLEKENINVPKYIKEAIEWIKE
ncbi:MAG: ATP-dependent nuclease, partial [Anaeroplasmataceae bacterium]